jgi:hypothetical protein
MKKLIRNILTQHITKYAVYVETHYKGPKFKEGDVVIRNWMAKIVIPTACGNGDIMVIESMIKYKNSTGLIFIGGDGLSGGDEFWFRKTRWWDWMFMKKDHEYSGAN